MKVGSGFECHTASIQHRIMNHIKTSSYFQSLKYGAYKKHRKKNKQNNLVLAKKR